MKRLTILCLLLLVGAAFAVDFDLIKESRIDMNPVTAVGSDGQIVYAGVGAALNIYNIYQKDFPAARRDNRGTFQPNKRYSRRGRSAVGVVGKRGPRGVRHHR